MHYRWRERGEKIEKTHRQIDFSAPFLAKSTPIFK
jgi:hypothetical protein